MAQHDQSEMATHIPLLVRTFEASSGPVLELGTGYFSTLLLHWLATVCRREVVSLETRPYWYKRALRYQSAYQRIEFCEGWDAAQIERNWGMVFVDHGPNERRPTEIRRLAHWADYIVIHDTNPEIEASYGYAAIWPLFRWRYDYTRVKPWTTVVSNCRDLSRWADPVNWHEAL